MQKPTFVAEISANHLGKLDRALKLIELAAELGADAVKFQTYEPRRLVGDPDLVLDRGPWKGRKLVELYREAWTPETWQPKMFAHARKLGLVAFSSPFSPEDVDFLEGVKCPIYKIASFEIADLDLIGYAAGTKKPMVISTGMATLPEIETAVDHALGAGAAHVTVLKCTSGYPTPLAEANVDTVRDLVDYFTFDGDDRVSVGLSDHTLGVAAALAAITFGAVMVEKHLTFSRAEGGPDAGFSAEPDQFRSLVKLGREVHATLGRVHYGPTECEAAQLGLRRALWIVADVPKGEKFTRTNLRSCRPCLGHTHLDIREFLGRKANRDIDAGTIFTPDLALAA